VDQHDGAGLRNTLPCAREDLVAATRTPCMANAEIPPETITDRVEPSERSAVDIRLCGQGRTAPTAYAPLTHRLTVDVHPFTAPRLSGP
jgi:hypothetical protein